MEMEYKEFNNIPIFKDNMTTFKETSYDKDGKEPRYMTNSEIQVINFDKVKNWYIKDMFLSSTPCSNDALYIGKDNKIFFVEFKNGFMDRPKQFAVRKKVYDSALIFTDITSKGISYMRNHMKYILVYNETANQGNNSDKDLKEKQKTAVQQSPAFDAFAKNVGRYANEEYVCFGLKIFQNYCFKEVHTYTEAEFDAYLSTL